MINNITAYIIAGGKSTRFKQDKSLYVYSGKPLIKHVYDKIAPIFNEIYIISNDINKFDFIGIETISDIIPGLGPIGGIYSALVHSKTPRSFMFPCDMPSLNPGLIEYMTTLPEDYDIIVPEIGDKFEPLHAIYSNSCIPHIKSLIDRKIHQLVQMYDRINLRKISEEEIAYYDDPFKIFKNINYFEDI